MRHSHRLLAELYMYVWYLTQHRCVVHLVVLILRGSWWCWGPGVVHSSFSCTLLAVRLQVEAEQRWSPRAETAGHLEHSQRELLETTNTTFSTFFSDSSISSFPLQRHISPKGDVSNQFTRIASVTLTSCSLWTILSFFHHVSKSTPQSQSRRTESAELFFFFFQKYYA